MFDMKVGRIEFSTILPMYQLDDYIKDLEAKIKELEDKLVLKQQTIELLQGAIK